MRLSPLSRGQAVLRHKQRRLLPYVVCASVSLISHASTRAHDCHCNCARHMYHGARGWLGATRTHCKHLVCLHVYRRPMDEDVLLPYTTALKAIALAILVLWIIAANCLVFLVLYMNPKLQVRNIVEHDFVYSLSHTRRCPIYSSATWHLAMSLSLWWCYRLVSLTLSCKNGCSGRICARCGFHVR